MSRFNCLSFPSSNLFQLEQKGLAIQLKLEGKNFEIASVVVVFS
jgi:hypothetical protein